MNSHSPQPKLARAFHQEASLWTPHDSNFRQREAQADLLPDLGIYVTSENKFPLLRGLLRCCPIEDFLIEFSRFSWLREAKTNDFKAVLEARGWDADQEFREHQMAFVIRTLLLDYAWEGERAWRVPQPERATFFRDLSSMATNSVARPELKQPVDGYAMMSRTAYQQFGDFERLKGLFSRSFLLLRDCAKAAEEVHGVDLDEVLKGLVGLTIDEAQSLAFAFFAVFSGGKIGPHFESGFMTTSPHFPGITRELMRAFIDWLSLDYAGFCKACELPEIGAVDGFDAYNLNPLVRHPILKLGDDLYVIPFPRYLFRRVTTGLFYDLINSKQQDRVGNVFGRAIEVYTRLLIEELPGARRILGEQAYAPKKSTCEWIVVEPSATVLVECKRRSLRQRAKTTGEECDMETSLNDEHGVVDGVAKLIETAVAVRAGQIDGVDPGKPIIGLLVTLDDFYLANSPYINGLITKSLSAKGLSLNELDLQLCPVADLEHLVWLLHTTNEGLADGLLRKMSNPEHIGADVGQWARVTWPPGEAVDIPSHRNAWDTSFMEVTAALRGDLGPLSNRLWTEEDLRD